MRQKSLLRLLGQAATLSVGIFVASEAMSPNVLTAAELDVVGGNSPCNNVNKANCASLPGKTCTSQSDFCDDGTRATCTDAHQPVDCNNVNCESHKREVCP